MIEDLLNRINVFVMSVVPHPITGYCNVTTPLQQCKDWDESSNTRVPYCTTLEF